MSPHSRHLHPKQGPGRLPLALELLAYNLLLVGSFPAMALWLAWRLLVRRKPLGEWQHRLGFVPPSKPGRTPRIWVHAVSAGEIAAAAPVINRLRQVFPGAWIAVSMHTETGMVVAQKTCEDADALFYLPFEWPGCIAAALCRLRPHLIVIVEKELWPNLLGMARLMRARVLVVNGRVSQRMLNRARWGPCFVRWLYRLPHLLCVQSPQDAARLRHLGISSEPLIVAGNTKVDALTHRPGEAEARLARDLAIAGHEVWLVAGSTHMGEEEVVVDAFRRIRDANPSARLLLAPRHLERVPAACAMVAQRGLSVARRTEPNPSRGQVIVLDTMGELRTAYGFASAGFVGGTLVPVGGHNLLEPLAAGTAVLFGPHTHNCADVADLVLQSGVGFRVRGAEDLAQEFLRIAADAEVKSQIALRARALIEQQRGAAARCVSAACTLLGSPAPPEMSDS